MKAPGLLFQGLAHVIAGGAVIVLGVAAAIVAYFGFLAWAAVSNSPLGGPLALPLLLSLGLGSALAASLFVFLPTTIASAYLCDRVLKWSHFMQIPTAIALSGIEVLLLSFVIALIRQADVGAALATGFFVWLLLLVPQGIYWWIVQIHVGLRWVAEKAWELVTKRRRRRRRR